MRNDDQIVFDEARQLIRDGDFEAALVPLDALIAVHPQSAALRWHRSRCLRQLDRDDEAAVDLDTVIALKPDYVPALLSRADLAEAYDAPDQAIALLRRALAIDALDPDVAYRLALLLADHTGATGEAIALLTPALATDPSRVEAWRLRADLRHRLAAEPAEGVAVVRDPLGMTYDRAQLEAALADYQAAVAIADDLRVDLRIADIAQRLGRHDEAVVQYDTVLARLAADDPVREHVQELRDRAAAGPAGERDHYANLIETALGAPSGDRNLQDDVATAALRSAAEQIRKGADVTAALDSFVSDSPDDVSATYIAHQIYNLAHEPPPGLEAATAGQFPAYQRKHVEAVRRAIEPLGYTHLLDAEASNLSAVLGQRVLIGLFVHPQLGAAAAYAMRPKWPGLLGFLVMLLSGKWRAQRMLECSSRFSDGIFLNTREVGADAFDYGAAEPFIQEKIADGSGPRKVAERHAERVRERLAALPASAVDVPTTLDAIEGQWIESSQLKAEYRRSLDYVTDAELRTLLGKHYDRYADRVRAKLALMTAE